MIRFFLSPVNNAEIKTVLRKLKSKSGKAHHYDPCIYYMNNERMLNQFKSKMGIAKRQGRNIVIELHAHGEPWGYESGDGQVTPFKLTEFLSQFDLEGAIIDLRFCNSASHFTCHYGSYNFAECLSKSLNMIGKTPVIYGYEAYIHSENYLKQSCVEEPVKHGAKVAHCKLEEARAIYQGGDLKQAASKTLNTFKINEMDDDILEFFKEKDDFELAYSIISQQPKQASATSLLHRYTISCHEFNTNESPKDEANDVSLNLSKLSI